MGYYERWKNRPADCRCNPPHSSVPSICPVHCRCMKEGRSTYIPMIDGMCRRCRLFPLYMESDFTNFATETP